MTPIWRYSEVVWTAALAVLQFLLLMVATVVILAGCTKTLVKDPVLSQPLSTAHCADGEWTDDSSVAVLPVPVVAFFVPHADVHEIRADQYLQRCGEPRRLINRKVEVARTACIPAAMTRIITLGIWQWCPAYVSWEADVTPPTASSQATPNLRDPTPPAWAPKGL